VGGRARYGEALELARADGDEKREAWVLTHLADARRESGQPDRAAKLFAHALAIGTARGDQGNRAWVLAQMAFALEDLAQPAQAQARAQSEAELE